MKLTKSKLKELIKEEVEKMSSGEFKKDQLAQAAQPQGGVMDDERGLIARVEKKLRDAAARGNLVANSGVKRALVMLDKALEGIIKESYYNLDKRQEAKDFLEDYFKMFDNDEGEGGIDIAGEQVVGRRILPDTLRGVLYDMEFNVPKEETKEEKNYRLRFKNYIAQVIQAAERQLEPREYRRNRRRRY